ncbi:hypothetical protein GCM10011571_11680 [Marinithermofilum abyssi]|uniref:Uncharacterized protein n=1 Tax=Marinithermofilum abyssi TaxID=1571185 RepID=A0A8J2YC56_9BACL|nr:hypothetical protein GCM10011571_11680 [Marinithermofilum abyssi]
MNFLFIDFLNSLWRDGVHTESLVDRLDKPGWLEAKLTNWNITIDRSPNKVELKKLKELRSWLYDLVVKLTNKISLNQEDVKQINQYLQKVSVHRKVVIKTNISSNLYL